MCGTTNRESFLTDDTGSRRFWIVTVRAPIDTKLLATMRDQLWAEAVCAYDSGKQWWLDASAEPSREEANHEFAEADSWTDVIAAWLAGQYEVTLTGVLCDAIKLEVGRHDRAAQSRAGKAIKLLGWRKVRVRDGFNRQTVYRPGHT